MGMEEEEEEEERLYLHGDGIETKPGQSVSFG